MTMAHPFRTLLVPRVRRRKYHTSEDDVDIPPLGMTTLVWGLFMGTSSNVRYQIVVGLERLIDLTIAKRAQRVSYFTTVGLRFANNIIGGENFIDMARWAGVQ
jgi:Protein RETICULATA-related